LQREVGITFVYVTHDQGEALSMSDRLAVMSAGRIEQIGTPRDVYFAPATAFVAGFIGKANLAPGQVILTQGRTIGRWGPLELDLPAGTPQGPCQFSLRFEAASIGPHGGDVTATGTIADIVFLGDTSEVVVALDGLRLTAKATAATGFGLVIGQQATVSFAGADVVRIDD